MELRLYLLPSAYDRRRAGFPLSGDPPVFLFLAQKKGMFVLHSASLLYLEKHGCFPVRREWGNRLITALWKKLFDTPFLNGDLNLIGKEGDQFVVYGIPWCGTSEIFTVEKKELGGIVLLEKAPEDKIVSLTKEQKTLRVMQRMISPPWTAGLIISFKIKCDKRY